MPRLKRYCGTLRKTSPEYSGVSNFKGRITSRYRTPFRGSLAKLAIDRPLGFRLTVGKEIMRVVSSSLSFTFAVGCGVGSAPSISSAAHSVDLQRSDAFSRVLQSRPV